LHVEQVTIDADEVCALATGGGAQDRYIGGIPTQIQGQFSGLNDHGHAAKEYGNLVGVAILRARLIERVKEFGVEVRPLPGRDDGFAALCYRGIPFAHFHNDNELDIRLTKTVIGREGLNHPPNSTVHPRRSKTSPWIELRFHTPADLDRVVRLVKLAVDAL
jgi:hypothetical protein